MSKIKSTLISLLIAGISAPLAAQAAMDLTLVNHTKYPSTVIINHGACSTGLPSHGTTNPGETNVVPAALVRGACGAHQKDCKGDVFMTNHCNLGGEQPVATATMNTTTGDTSIQMTAYGQQLGYNLHIDSPFHITMDGGPAAATK